MATTMTSRQFNQDTSRAKKAAEKGPVYITDRGKPAHVLLTIEDFEHLVGEQHVIDLLGEPVGVEDIDLPVISSDQPARPASFD
jgi:PHD/YefM family antitoxin component YafN of YafNO toxin-antitoxin module